ncbi:Kae1-associated serine/threonine protein kinase [Candidatus Pacearchaeota archaeon]|nr:Kae1-associated serine/threonine protein kinase [Candidatus Pacearchaeota archaeon]
MTKSKLLAQGAEAVITRTENKVTKNRIPKSYRLKELDEKIRTKRTEKEAKILTRAKKISNVPEVLAIRKFDLDIEFIEGDKLSEKLNSYEEKKQFEIMQKIGEQVTNLHQDDIIHGDLTTSNIILRDKDIFIIDFGLGFISKRTEDKAVDLHLIKQALEAKHFQNYEKLFHEFKKGYEKNHKDSKEILDRLKKVESRGRYKNAG